MNAPRLPWFTLPLALLLSWPALAGELAVNSTWARATPPGAKVAAVYLVIDNQSTKSDRLLKLRSPVAASAEVHRSSVEDGIARMRPVTVLHVGAGERIAFEPGGLHVMLMGLRKPLIAGQTFELELVFEVAGPRRVVVSIRE